MSYARKFYKGTSPAGNRIYVANSLGTCEVMVYETTYAQDLRAAFHFDSGNGVLAWSQIRDDGDTSKSPRRVIKTASFQVTNGAVVGLPLASRTAYTTPTSTNTGINDVEVSPDGSRLAFSMKAGPFLTGGDVTTSVFACGLASCQSSLETAFERKNANVLSETGSSQQSGGTNNIAFGRGAGNVERLYYVYRPNAVFSDGDIVAIDNMGDGQWSGPTIIVDRDDRYGTSIGDTDTILYDVSAHSDAGMPDLLVIQSGDYAVSTAPLRIDTYDTHTGELKHAIGQGSHPTWTNLPTLDGQAPNILVSGAYCCSITFVDEIDPDGPPYDYARLGSISGYHVDSAE